PPPAAAHWGRPPADPRRGLPKPGCGRRRGRRGSTPGAGRCDLPIRCRFGRFAIMQIRPESFDDRAAVYAVTHAAFTGIDPMVEPDEVGLLQQLFDCAGYDARFSIVALDDAV